MPILFLCFTNYKKSLFYVSNMEYRILCVPSEVHWACHSGVGPRNVHFSQD